VRQQRTNAAQLSQNPEAACDCSCDLKTHADISVDYTRWLHVIAAHLELQHCTRILVVILIKY